MKQKLFVITGPTAIGKSSAAVNLALKTGSSVISADSMQIYRGLNIGTGKITEREKHGIKHYMIDVVNPDEDYSVGQYVKDAENIINECSVTPVIAGGTGLYITSLINGSDFGGIGRDENIREKWKQIATQKGKEYVHNYLTQIDPESAAVISVNDIKRTIRAIEIYEISGIPKSRLVSSQSTKYDAKILVLFEPDREKLYKNINDRVDKMFDAGLIDEVKGLLKYQNCQSMQAIGYKETAEYLEGRITLSDAKELIKQNSRNYAKRQITYFRGMKAANKIFVENKDNNSILQHFINF